MNYKDVEFLQKELKTIQDNSLSMSQITVEGGLDESTLVMFLVGLNQSIKEMKELVDLQVKRNKF